VQPLPPELDYFTCLGVPRRLQLDPQVLTDRFHERSRRVHPDFFQTKSARERALSLEASALLNRAYRTLRDPIERVAYLIRLETGQQEIAAKAPNELLEEIFTLQELVVSYRAGAPAGGGLETIRTRLVDEQARLGGQLTQLDGELQRLSAEWDRVADQGDEPAKGAVIARLRDRLAGRQYLVNTIDEMTMTLEGRSDAKDRRH
jgi:molecular chaperone HscB